MENLVPEQIKLNEKATHVVGITLTRHNKDTNKLEVLLIRGHRGRCYFPGGKMEEGESAIEAMRRELKEELGIELPKDHTALYNQGVIYYGDNGREYFIHNYILDVSQVHINPKIQPMDTVTEFVWTSKPLGYDLTEQARFILKDKDLFGKEDYN